jgi:hypothetical protein
MKYADGRAGITSALCVLFMHFVQRTLEAVNMRYFTLVVVGKAHAYIMHFVCMCVCVCVCMYVCMYVCMNECKSLSKVNVSVASRQFIPETVRNNIFNFIRKLRIVYVHIFCYEGM